MAPLMEVDTLFHSSSSLSSPDVSVGRKKPPISPRKAASSSPRPPLPRRTSQVRRSSSSEDLAGPGVSARSSSLPPVTKSYLNKAIQWHQKQRSDPSVVASLYNQLGNLWFRERNHKAAADAYKAAVECHAGLPTADGYANLGTVYWATGRTEWAMDMLGEALKGYRVLLDPRLETPAQSLQIANVHHQLGLAYCLQNQYDEAVESLGLAQAIREGRGAWVDVAKSMDALGYVYYCKSELSTALGYHQSALGLFDRYGAPKWSTLKRMAKIYRRLEEWQGALCVYQAMLQAQVDERLPDKLRQGVYQAMAQAHRHLGHDDEAATCERKATS